MYIGPYIIVIVEE